MDIEKSIEWEIYFDFSSEINAAEFSFAKGFSDLEIFQGPIFLLINVGALLLLNIRIHLPSICD